MRSKHPDVCDTSRPKARAAIWLEQIRDIVADTSYGAHPGAQEGLYILDRVDLLGRPANAFLKDAGGTAVGRGADPARAYA